jgi:DNA (cytosine-5)-methyltransferase 1
MKKPIKILSLFSGGGGLDLGFSKVGCSVNFSTDIEHDFCETLKINNNFFPSNHQIECKDICQLVPENIINKNFDFFIGGPPCQSFSAAGRRAGGVTGINDLRGSLFWHYCRLLEHFSPKGFLFENVKGILSSNKKNDWMVIKKSFESLGYNLFFRVLDAAEYGVPQHRERLILVGVKDGTFKFPRPTHGPCSKNGIPYISAEEAIKDLQDSNEKQIPYSGKYGDLLMEIPPGLNYLFFTEKMNHPNPRFAWRSRFSDFLYVADPSRPTKTIVAKQGKFGGPFHWNKRKFTFAEFKRLFSFPDDYNFIGSQSSKMVQLGNSVPPKFAEVLGKAILQQFFNIDYSIDLIDNNFKSDLDTRKSIKAKNTRSSVKPNKPYNNLANNQLNLFHSENKTLNGEKEYSLKWFYNKLRSRVENDNNNTQYLNSYDCKLLLKNGNWEVFCEKENKKGKGKKILYELNFFETINKEFNNIFVTLKTDNSEEIGVAWDLIDFCIQESTSYDGIDKLYGHFTEPYPKFKLKLNFTGNIKDPILNFAKVLCDFSFSKQLHPFQTLGKIFSCSDNMSSLTKKLITIGFDIRTHQTNRSVPEGYFRVVYPFTKSLEQHSFTKWKEKGTHKTSDFTSIPAD